MTRRAIRAQRKAKEEMRHMTGWPPSELMQDDSKELSHWFSEKPDAMRLIRERCAEIEAERSFTLPNGTAITNTGGTE